MKYLTLFFAIAVLYGCSSSDKSNESRQILSLPVLTIKEDSVTLYTEFPARIEGKVNVNIRPQVEGYIQKIFIEEGTYVKTGQSLFKIDDRQYIEQVNTAKANLNAALAALKNAQLEVDKYTLLSGNNITSDFQLKAAQAQYGIAQANVEQQRAALETAKINLSFTLIKSPVDGFIGRIPKRIGSLVSPSDTQALTTLSDISEIYAYFSMSEKDFLRFNARYEGKDLTDKLSKVENVSLKLADDSEYPHSGKIQMINGEFDTNIGAISVRAMFQNPNRLLRTGNTGRIILPYIENKALQIPILSTLDIQDKIFVIRLNRENKAERVPVTVDAKQGDYYIVRAGLKAGDRIVTKDLETIKEGTIIQPE